MDRLTQVVEEALPEGAELVEARFSRGPLFTLLVDNLDGPADHEFTSRVVRSVSAALDEDGYDGMVEVSSPGIERPLNRPEHFKRFAGHEARVRVGEPIEGRRNFTGTIGDVDESGFSLELSEEAGKIEVSFDRITRANLKEDLKK